MEEKELEKETADDIKEAEEEGTQEGISQEESAVQEETAAPEAEESAGQTPPYLRSGRGSGSAGPCFMKTALPLRRRFFRNI